MEEYLQHMKTLRCQMNDVEDQAAKISAEEQSHVTAIHTMERDLDSANLETKTLKEDTELMMKAKGQICSGILEKQRKIASLESDSSTLLQTLDLIQQEKVNSSAKIVEKSAYYVKVSKEFNSKLQQQQDWVHSHESGHLTFHNLGNDGRSSIMAKLDSAKAKLNEIAQMRSELVTEIGEINQSLELVKFRAKDFKGVDYGINLLSTKVLFLKSSACLSVILDRFSASNMPELLEMDIKALDEEYDAILSDKASEFEYFQSLQNQIEKLKGISHIIKCVCGVEFNVTMDHCAL